MIRTVKHLTCDLCGGSFPEPLPGQPDAAIRRKARWSHGWRWLVIRGVYYDACGSCALATLQEEAKARIAAGFMVDRILASGSLDTMTETFASQQPGQRLTEGEKSP